MSNKQSPITVKQTVVQWLKDVSTGEIDLGESGMCEHLENMLGIVSVNYTPQTYDILTFLRVSMGAYSAENGTTWAFPVPHPTLRSMDAYLNHIKGSSISMNDMSEYGLNRRKLAEILADELENSDVG